MAYLPMSEKPVRFFGVRVLLTLYFDQEIAPNRRFAGRCHNGAVGVPVPARGENAVPVPARGRCLYGAQHIYMLDLILAPF